MAPPYAWKRRLLLAGLGLWGLSALLVLADPGVLDRGDEGALLLIFAPAGLGTVFVTAGVLMDLGGQVREVGDNVRTAKAEGSTPLTRGLLGVGALLLFGGFLVLGIYMQNAIRGILRSGFAGEEGQTVLLMLGVIGLGGCLIVAGYALERRRKPAA